MRHWRRYLSHRIPKLSSLEINGTKCYGYYRETIQWSETTRRIREQTNNDKNKRVTRVVSRKSIQFHEKKKSVCTRTGRTFFHRIAENEYQRENDISNVEPSSISRYRQLNHQNNFCGKFQSRLRYYIREIVHI